MKSVKVISVLVILHVLEDLVQDLFPFHPRGANPHDPIGLAEQFGQFGLRNGTRFTGLVGVRKRQSEQFCVTLMTAKTMATSKQKCVEREMKQQVCSMTRTCPQVFHHAMFHFHVCCKEGKCSAGYPLQLLLLWSW